MDDNELLKINNLRVSIPLDEGNVVALDGIDLSIQKGKVIGIVGESGCGKSITARSILRILPPPGKIDSGEILFRTKIGSSDGEDHIIDLAKLDIESEVLRQIRWGEISMVFQEPMSSFSAYHTIGNQMMEALLMHQEISKDKAREKAISMLDRVGIPNGSVRIDQYPHEFSGGMRQRAMIGMALICNPAILIADEPTTSLDVTIQAQILDLFKEIRRDFGSSIMFITHNLGVIAQIADEVAIMYLGRIIEYGSTREIFHNYQHPYTKSLVHAIPKIGDLTKKRLVAIQGSVPGSFERPTGCSFHNRCPQAMPGVCDVRKPKVTDVGNGHIVECLLFK